MKYRTTIGLEVHVQLNTRSKLFCGCSHTFGAAPNTQVCPVCLGYPGAMPRLNGEAVRKTVRTGLMIASHVPPVSRFDRKSYFYPDMPKNYQISQYDEPLCIGGELEITVSDGVRKIGITRIHLEEDVGKSTHAGRSSLVDFNRAGIPLMEIVTDPDLTSAAEAFAFLHALKQVLEYLDVSDCNLEQGNLRCDVNVSVRPTTQEALGAKVEIKNMNTFRGVNLALEYEIDRQQRMLDAGSLPVQETRRWDPEGGRTEPMRSKEDAHDYRYFPEPDLLPVCLSATQIAQWRDALPESPSDRRTRFSVNYGLSDYDADRLSCDRRLADFFEKAAVVEGGTPKTVGHLLMTEVLCLVDQHARSLADAALTPAALGALAALVDNQTINLPTAKKLLPELFFNGGMPDAMVTDRDLGQICDDLAIAEWVRQILADHPGAVRDFHEGKPTAARFLVGQVMKFSRGKADPRRVAAAVDAALSQLISLSSSQE